MYTPHPIDTANVTLPESLQPLVERLAEHNHDVWAQGRIAEGWTWGPKRDDAAKEHPDLIAYTDLSDGEKKYDRNSVVETLKAIVALGYRIEHGPK
jgi:hypothetical protein